MRKTALLGLLTLILVFGVVGCDLFGTTATTSSTTATTITTTISSDTSVTTTTSSELEVRLLSIYQLAVSSGSFTGTYEEWLESVRGPAGREIALRVNGGYVQWQYAGETAWNDLIALTALVGPAGQNGQTPTFRVSGTKLQWQFPGEATWTDLFDLSILTGNTGTDGKEIALRVEGGFLQWQREGDLVWTNLIDLSTLIAQPTISISVDGFWVINGVKTDYPATAQVLPQTVDVAFEPNGGTMPEGFTLTIQVPKGDAIDLPIPVKDGYVFLGWITGEGIHDIRYTDYTPFVRDTTLHAVWSQDNTALLAFLSAPDGMNYTGQKRLHVQATVDGVVVIFDQTGEMKIMQKDGWTYRSHFDQERDLIEGAWVVRHQEWGFEQIHTLAPRAIAESIKFQPFDGNLKLWMEMDELRNETGFDLFDPALFVKRPGENKYDYPITDEQLKLYGVPVGDEVVLTTVECHLDLDAGQIVIRLEGEAKMDSPAYHPVVATLTLWLYDVGTTVVEAPIIEAAQAVKNEIDRSAGERRNHPEYQAAYLASKDAFDDLIETFLTQIPMAQDLRTLWHLQNDAVNAIGSFAFEYDALALKKAEAEAEANRHLDWLCRTATADSCQALRAHHAAFFPIVLQAMDESELHNRLNQYDDALRELYVEDPEAAALERHRDRMLEILDAYREILEPLIPNEAARNLFQQTCEVARNAIKQATTVEQIDLAYGAFSQTLLNASIEWGDWTEAKAFLIDQLEPWGIILDTLDSEGFAYPAQIRQLYLEQMATLSQATDLIATVAQTVAAYRDLEANLLGPWIARGLAKMTDAKDAIIAGLDPLGQAMLQDRYQQDAQRIAKAEGPWEVDDVLNAFLQFTEGFLVDNWTPLVAEKIAEIAAMADAQSPLAEEASAQAMGALVPLASAALSNIPRGDHDRLFWESEAWKQAVLFAFVPALLDEGMAELANAKAEQSEFVESMYAYARMAMSEGQSFATLDAWRDGYLEAIAQAMTIQEVSLSTNGIPNALLALNLAYRSNLDAIRFDILGKLDAMHAQGLQWIPAYSEDVETAYLNYRSSVAAATDPVILAMSGANPILTFRRMFRQEVHSYVLFDIEQRFMAAAELAFEEHAWLYAALRDFAATKLARSLSFNEIHPLLSAYDQAMALLPKDPFKTQIRQALMQWHERFNLLYPTAADASKNAMIALIPTVETNMRSAVDFEQLQGELNAALLLLEDTYDLDLGYWELEHYRSIYRRVGMEIVQTIQYQAGSEELDHLLMSSYWQVVDQWNQDIDSTNMHAHYETWLTFVEGLQFAYNISLAELVQKLTVELDREYEVLLAYGVAGEYEVETVMSFMRVALEESTSHARAIANRVMGEYGAAESTQLVLFGRAQAELQLVYSQYQAVVHPDSLPALQTLLDDTLQALRLEFESFDHSALILSFHQKASLLP